MSNIFDSSIFIKQSELKRTEHKLKKEDLTKIIPKSCLENEDVKLQEIMIEWRWRIYEINNKTYTEISMLEPGKKRVYLNKYEKWTEQDIDPQFNKFIKKTYYYYAK